MGLHYNSKENSHCTIGIWEIEEPLDMLIYRLKSEYTEAGLPVDLAPLEQMKSHKRKLEWVAERILLNEIAGKPVAISYDRYGKPFLSDSDNQISIAHSDNMVAVIHSTDSEVGIDIERISDKIGKIALRFLSAEEYEALSQHDRIFHLYLHWCAKEALYKLFGKKDLIFAENLHIPPFQCRERTGRFEGRILKNNYSEPLELRYFTSGEFVVVYTCKN